MRQTPGDSTRDPRARSVREAPATARRRDIGRRAAGFQPLELKLRPARVGLELVPRRRLMHELSATRAPLVLVSAPAGAGKTTTLTQWVERQERPTAWLQLDETDADPVVLLTYLALALETVAPVDPAVFDLLQLRRPPIRERVMPMLGTALAAAPPFVLVLDDAHLVTNDLCWQLVELLLDQLPADAQIAIGSRSDPPLPLARLLAAGRLAAFRMDDLAMERDEARELLRLRDIAVDEETLGKLLDVTEGWATGLYLAVLAGGAHPAHDWISHVRGDQRDLAGYFAAEVLERQSDDLRTFLTETAVLDRLSPGLCHAVTGRDDAHLVLTKLANENLFVTSLDDRQEWYRYHHLFGELLLAELERSSPGRVAKLHRRAAGWYRRHDDPERTVAHALAAGDADSVADLAAQTCDLFQIAGQTERARQLLARFSDEQVLAHAPLALEAGMLAQAIDDSRLARLGRAACRMTVPEGLSPVGAVSLRSWQLMVRAAIGPDGIARMKTDAEAACRLEEHGDRDWLLHARRLLAYATYLSGALRRAEKLLMSILRESDTADDQAWVLAMLALIAGDEGRWDDAAELDRQVQARELEYVQAPIPLAHARMLAHRGDPELGAYIAGVEPVLRGMFFGVEYKRLVVTVMLAEACLEGGDAVAAERFIAEAEQVLKVDPDAGMLRGRAERLRQALEQRRLTDPLTPAERRVLELLPTQLTAAQMAARLFLSTNTVKSHMRRLYAKLEVTTRTAAVERARALGLLRTPERV